MKYEGADFTPAGVAPSAQQAGPWSGTTSGQGGMAAPTQTFDSPCLMNNRPGAFSLQGTVASGPQDPMMPTAYPAATNNIRLGDPTTLNVGGFAGSDYSIPPSAPRSTPAVPFTPPGGFPAVGVDHRQVAWGNLPPPAHPGSAPLYHPQASHPPPDLRFRTVPPSSMGHFPTSAPPTFIARSRDVRPMMGQEPSSSGLLQNLENPQLIPVWPSMAQPPVPTPVTLGIGDALCLRWVFRSLEADCLWRIAQVLRGGFHQLQRERATGRALCLVNDLATAAEEALVDQMSAPLRVQRRFSMLQSNRHSR